MLEWYSGVWLLFTAFVYTPEEQQGFVAVDVALWDYYFPFAMCWCLSCKIWYRELIKAEVGQVNNPDMIYDAAQFCKPFPGEHY